MNFKKQKVKKPWPTKAAMHQIYERHLWGGTEFQFYSGDGSHHPEIVNPYVAELESFLKSFKRPLTVCDLGCGDFNVGSQLVKFTQQYIAIDIVENLIEHNKNKYIEDNLSFHCLNIAADKLPTADCAIVRQVLQHLSNREVQQVLQKLKNFKYVVLTEHIPNGNFNPNKDIISGQGIRLKKQSGLDVLLPPFNFKVKIVKEMLSIVLPDNKGVLVTTLFTLF